MPPRRKTQSEADYREIFDAAGDALFVHDPETGEVVDINRKVTEMYGFRRDELDLLNAHFRTYVGPPHSFEDRVRHIKRAMEAGPFVFEWLAKHRDGHRFWVEVSLKRAFIGGCDRILAAVRDITQRKAAEEALRQSEARSRAVVESQTEMIIRVRPDGTVTFVNEAMCRFAGVAREALVGANAMLFLSEADQARVRGLIAATASDRGPLTGETAIQVAPGRVQWMAWEGRGFFDEAGCPTEFQAVCRDITERKAAEEALGRSEEKWRSLFEQTLDGISVIGQEGIIEVNEAYARVHGRPKAELIGHPVWDFLLPHEKDRAQRRIAELLKGPAPDRINQYQLVRPDGTTAWMEVRSRAATWDGKPAIQSITRDITERKAAEAARRQERDRAQSYLEIAGVVLVALAADQTVTLINKKGCEVLGRGQEEIVGRNWFDTFVPQGVRDAAKAVFSELMGGRVQVAEYNENPVWTAKGEERLIAWHNTVLRDEAGRVVGTLSSGEDITDRKRLEEELREAQKMEAVGQLAGGIAHDFNNLMTGVLCHAGLLKAASRPGDEVHETAGIIEAAARRASDLTGQLLGFARRGKHQDVPVDLCETVRTVIRLVGGAMDPRIRIEVDGPGGAVWTHGDPAQMEQVILNLAVNARDAMPAGGRMGFAIREVVLDEKACAGRAGAKPGRHVCVAVSDTGCGIPDEIRGHLFEPFFTTKPLGKGIGMGLAMVYGIAKNHGGWVEVTSQVDRGSTFTVYLPVSAAPRPQERRRPEPSTCGVGCILLVDDDAAIRQGASRMLTAAGYRVASAANVDEALRAYDSLGCKVDLVIIDMVMPGGDGGACFHALRRLDPTVKAILCTAGGVDEAAARELLGEGMVGFMPKPFQMDQLAAAVRKALAGG